MIEPIATPKVGDGLRASWGASVASAINQLANGLETRAKPLENQRTRRGGAAVSPLAPWQFSPDSGWSNGIVQVGLTFFATDHGGDYSLYLIENTETTSDGFHYLKISPSKVSIVVDPNYSETERIAEGVIYMPLAEIKDGAVERHYLPMNPVIPTRL